MYKPSTPAEWYAEAGVFSRALRGLADRWDTALTNGASHDVLESIIGEVDDVGGDMMFALEQFPEETLKR
jgi:hypothetical protein